jgi:hypothetical protein
MADIAFQGMLELRRSLHAKSVNHVPEHLSAMFPG